MCEPTYFDVVCSVNPWMDPTRPTDVAVALCEWKAIYECLRDLGHEVQLIPPLPSQPDMVFCANAGVVVGTRGMAARFRAPFRLDETVAYHDWLITAGVKMAKPAFVSEGEGDFVVMPGSVPGRGLIFGGWGVRSDLGAQRELARHLDVEVVALQLVDERFYHLDTALTIVDHETAAYVPMAFAPASIALIEQHFPTTVRLDDADALVLGANAVSDGLHVLCAEEAKGFHVQLADLGFVPIPLAVSELRKSGGAVRCCVLELF
jgi:N-dimethylarginine dimethylaminohydrolase